jgi:hypothetical protein
MNMNNSGIFTISLDFELFWGVKNHNSLAKYGQNILGERIAIPAMLQAFKEHHVSVTWATVGFLFFNEKESLLSNLPSKKPSYSIPHLSSYFEIEKIGKNEREDPYHFGKELLELISSFPGQEIATHTFSHYYCLEKGQTIEQFEDDIFAAIKTGERNGFKIVSLVFPRNQLNSNYLEVCRKLGIKCYRGNESSWIYKARNLKENVLFKRAFRLLDSYLNLSGHNTYKLDIIAQNFPYNIPSSRFLRPYSSSLKLLESLRLKRIKDGMLYAAQNNSVYHIWWHPHNFGKDIKQNMEVLNTILEYYTKLKAEYNMQSMNMRDIAEKLDSGGR